MRAGRLTHRQSSGEVCVACRGEARVALARTPEVYLDSTNMKTIRALYTAPFFAIRSFAIRSFAIRSFAIRSFAIRSFAILWAAGLAAPAFASGGGENNIFAGDFGNVLWTLLIFFLVLGVLGKYAWGPLLESLKAREDFIRESLESAKRDRDQSEVRLKEYDDKLTEARAEATAIVEEGRRDSEVLRQRIEEEARAEAERMIERAKREIGIAKETAVKELYTLSGSLATDIASRIVGRELKAEDHQRLIEESISDLEQLGPNQVLSAF